MARAAMTQKEAADEVVERARLGDQNAKAQIEAVGHNARAGDPRARTAYALILATIQKNPPRAALGAQEISRLGIVRAADRNPPEAVLAALCELPAIGTPETLTVAVVCLSLCQPWTQMRVASTFNAIAEPFRPAYKFGLASAMNRAAAFPEGPLEPSALGAVCAGYCIGSARALQLARLKQVPPSVLGAAIGWELDAS